MQRLQQLMVLWSSSSRMEVLQNSADPIGVNLDEVKAEHIISLTNDLLRLLSSQTPVIGRLIKSCQFTSDSTVFLTTNWSFNFFFLHKHIDLYPADSTAISLDPGTAHPKLIISPKGDSATYTDTWQQLPDLPGRFDTTLNVISSRGHSRGRHYWEIDVTGKTYWELGVTYPTIPRKGTTEDCWLGRGDESWCVEFFDGEYTACTVGFPISCHSQNNSIGSECFVTSWQGW